MRGMSGGTIRRFFLGHPEMKDESQYGCHWKSIRYNWEHHEKTLSSSLLERADHQQVDNDDVAATSVNEEKESLGALLEQQKRLDGRIEAKIPAEAEKTKHASAEYRWTHSAIPPKRKGFHNAQARITVPGSQRQASQHDRPSRAPSYPVMEPPGNPVASQLSSGSSHSRYGAKRAVLFQIPPLHHPNSFARRAALKRGASSMGRTPSATLLSVPGPPTLDAERWICTPAQLPANGAFVASHARVPKVVDQLDFRATGVADHQQNRKYEVPAAMGKGIPSPFEVASQRGLHPTQTSFSHPDRDRRKVEVRSDSSRHDSSNMPTPASSGGGRPRALYIRRRASSARHGYPAMPPASAPRPHASPNAPQRQLGYYNAPNKNKDDDQEEHQMPLSFNEEIRTRQGQAQQDHNHEVCSFFQAHQNDRPTQTGSNRPLNSMHHDYYHPQVLSNHFLEAPSPYAQPLKGQATRSLYDLYGARRQQTDDLSQDYKRAMGNNSHRTRNAGYKGGCWQSGNGYTSRRDPDLGPGLGGGAQTNPYVGKHYDAGDLSGGNPPHGIYDRYGRDYRNGVSDDVSERRKKRTILHDGSYLNFGSSDFSNVEEYGRWKRGEPFRRYGRRKGKEPEVLMEQGQMAASNPLTSWTTSQRNEHTTNTLITSPPYPEPPDRASNIDRLNSHSHAHAGISSAVTSQPRIAQPVSALKAYPEHPIQKAKVAVAQASATDSPRPDSMTLPAAAQPRFRPWKSIVPVPTKPSNLVAGARAKKSATSVAEQAKASRESDRLAETPKPLHEDVPVGSHPESTRPRQAAIQPASSSRVEPHRIAKEKALSLAEITKQKRERAAERRAQRKAQEAQNTLTPRLSRLRL